MRTKGYLGVKISSLNTNCWKKFLFESARKYLLESAHNALKVHNDDLTGNHQKVVICCARCANDDLTGDRQLYFTFLKNNGCCRVFVYTFNL